MKVMFVTYSAASGQLGDVAFMGVLKRCIRLIKAIPNGEIDPFLVNFGELPMSDPLVAQVVSEISVIPEALIPKPGQFHELFDWIKPDVIVLGEGPCAGAMKAISREAATARIPQVGIENFYHLSWVRKLPLLSPTIDQWLLLGLPLGRNFGRLNSRLVLAPPLIAKADSIARSPRDITILGYDQQVLEAGLALLKQLPSQVSVRVIHPDGDSGVPATSREIEWTGLPDEATLSSWLASSKIVVAKNGYQQIVESLALGTPLVLHSAPGGVWSFMMANEIRSRTRFFPKRFTLRSRRKLRRQCREWLGEKPHNPWEKSLAAIPDYRDHAAKALLEILRGSISTTSPATTSHSDLFALDCDG